MDRFERKLNKELNQRTVPKDEFARILGRTPRLRPIKFQLVEPAMLEAFGPAERINRPKSALVYWNFVRKDGKKNFTIFARILPKTKPEKVIINLTAAYGALSFYAWVTDRIGAVENGDAAPLFRGSGAFSIMRVA